MIDESKVVNWIDEELEFIIPVLERLSESTFTLWFCPWLAKDYLRVAKSLKTLKWAILSGVMK